MLNSTGNKGHYFDYNYDKAGYFIPSPQESANAFYRDIFKTSVKIPWSFHRDLPAGKYPPFYHQL